MSSITLTPQQLAEIVFQRPGHLTEGFLDKRSPLEKLRDRFLIYRDTRVGRNGHPTLRDRLYEKLFLEFDQCEDELLEHPRSLSKASLELQAAGFSHAQIKGIKYWANVFVMSYMDHGKLRQEVKKDFPNEQYGPWDDRAFMGTPLHEKSTQSSNRGYI